MELHSVYLRTNCILLEHLDPVRERLGKGRTHMDDVYASAFDTMIRHAGGHVTWMAASCSPLDYAPTRGGGDWVSFRPRPQGDRQEMQCCGIRFRSGYEVSWFLQNQCHHSAAADPAAYSIGRFR